MELSSRPATVWAHGSSVLHRPLQTAFRRTTPTICYIHTTYSFSTLNRQSFDSDRGAETDLPAAPNQSYICRHRGAFLRITVRLLPSPNPARRSSIKAFRSKRSIVPACAPASFCYGLPSSSSNTEASLPPSCLHSWRGSLQPWLLSAGAELLLMPSSIDLDVGRGAATGTASHRMRYPSSLPPVVVSATNWLQTTARHSQATSTAIHILGLPNPAPPQF
jgi:hypothetical protein